MVAGPAPTRPSRVLDLKGPVLVFWVATVVSLASLVIAGVNRSDEVWNLHVITRMLQGDVLYKDIRYFPTPLAPFAGVFAATVFGAKLIVLKSLLAVSFGVTAAAMLSIARMLLIGRRGRLLLITALLLFALPPISSLYNTMVITWLSVTAALVLRWDDATLEPPDTSRARRLFWRATALGAAAGACFLTKYNIGLVGAVAVAVSMVVPLVQRRIATGDFVTSALTASGAWLLTVAVGMTPVLLQGAGGDFVRQLLDGSSLLDAPVAFQKGWQELLEGVANASMLEIRTVSCYALIPISGLIGALAIARTRSVVRSRLITVCLFSVASAVLAIPRTDHLIWAAPLPLALLVGSAAHVLRPWGDARPVTATVLRSWSLGFAVTWLCLALVLEAVDAGPFELVRSGPFQGALLAPGEWREIVRDAGELRERIGPDRKVLILHLEAGLYYLAGGLRNPTRYDYPDAFEFGTTGLAEVKAALADKSVRFTCIGRDYPRELEPARVIATVQTQGWRVAKLRACDLWRTDPYANRRPS